MEETITISKKEYDEMKKAYEFLLFLQQVGIASWEYYDYALETYSMLKNEHENKVR